MRLFFSILTILACLLFQLSTNKNRIIGLDTSISSLLQVFEWRDKKEEFKDFKIIAPILRFKNHQIEF